MTGPDPQREVRTAATAEVGPDRLTRIRALLERAFDDPSDGPFRDEDWTHCLGGTHVWAEDDGEVVAHASVVLRRLVHDGQPHGERVLRCGYVEAVAVRDDRRRTGLGGAVMQTVESLVRGGCDLDALGATAAGARLYRPRGWRPWRGFLGHLTPDGVRPDPDELGSILVLELDGVPLDLDGSLVCGVREGDPW